MHFFTQLFFFNSHSPSLPPPQFVPPSYQTRLCNSGHNQANSASACVTILPHWLRNVFAGTWLLFLLYLCSVLRCNATAHPDLPQQAPKGARAGHDCSAERARCHEEQAGSPGTVRASEAEALQGWSGQSGGGKKKRTNIYVSKIWVRGERCVCIGRWRGGYHEPLVHEIVIWIMTLLRFSTFVLSDNPYPVTREERSVRLIFFFCEMPRGRLFLFLLILFSFLVPVTAPVGLFHVP